MKNTSLIRALVLGMSLAVPLAATVQAQTGSSAAQFEGRVGTVESVRTQAVPTSGSTAGTVGCGSSMCDSMTVRTPISSRIPSRRYGPVNAFVSGMAIWNVFVDLPRVIFAVSCGLTATGGNFQA
ncbi:MAG: hypothetical protein MUE49_14090 [Rhodospirillales bacterium]|nr:hypothetical protein [Rhodospirillales bacterium]